jgi:hypothetical protein
MKRIAAFLSAVALLGGCGDDRIASESAMAPETPPVATDLGDIGATEHRELAALRAATVRFQHIDLAQSPGGFDTQFPPGCFSSAEGGMGFHWINSNNVGKLNVTEPQLLLYEPEKNGNMKLVGVEYIVPGDPTDPAPLLFNRQMKYNTTFKVWALHAWVWKENPAGIFADWNPTVSCAYATVQAAGSHH